MPASPARTTIRSRRLSTTCTNRAENSSEENNHFSNGVDDVSASRSSRQYRDSDTIGGSGADRPFLNSTGYERGRRRRVLSSSTKASIIEGEKQINVKNVTKNNTNNKSTTDGEIERIREMRARRLKKEQHERNKAQEHHQGQKDHTNIGFIERIEQRRHHHRRVSAPSSIRRQDTDTGTGTQEAGSLTNEHHYRRNCFPTGEKPSSQDITIEEQQATGKTKRRILNRAKSEKGNGDRKSERRHLRSITTQSDISEKLRERREGREKERKERENIYKFNTIPDETNRSNSGSISLTRSANNNDGNKTEIESSCSSDFGIIINNNTKRDREPYDNNQTVVSDADADADADADGDMVDSRQGFSIRLCVVSVTNLPSHVVPKMPLCPVLNFTLIQLPIDANVNDQKRFATSIISEELKYSDSVRKIPSSKTFSTSTKILSQHDNGTIGKYFVLAMFYFLALLLRDI